MSPHLNPLPRGEEDAKRQMRAAPHDVQMSHTLVPKLQFGNALVLEAPLPFLEFQSIPHPVPVISA